MKYIGKIGFRFLSKNDWAFGISWCKNEFCDNLYKEYEFRIDFWKWSIGVVW